MNWLDFLVVAIVVVSTFYGWQRGFVSQTFDLAGWILGVIAALKYDALIVSYTLAFAKIDLATVVPRSVRFIVIFLCVRLAILFLGRLVRTVAHLPVLGFFDTAGGAAFGFVKASIQVLALFMLMGFMRPEFFEKAVDESIYSYRIDEFASVLVKNADESKKTFDEIKGIMIPQEEKKE